MSPARIVPATLAVLVLALHVAGKVARDTLFLSHVGVAALPLAMGLAAVLSVAAAAAVSALASRRSAARTLTTLLLSAAALLAVSALSLPVAPHLAAWTLYLSLSAAGPLLVSVLWMHFAERARGAVAEDEFATLATAATFGGVVGGVFAERTAVTFGAASLLTALGAGLVIAAGALALDARIRPAVLQPDVPRPNTLPPPRRGPGAVASLRDTQASPALQRLALLLTLSAVMTAVADYVMKRAAAETLAGEGALLAFFSLFHTFTAVGAFLVQLTLGQAAIRRLGVRGTLTLIPLVFLALAGFGAVALRWSTGVLLRSADAILSNSLFRSSYELVYLSLPSREHRASKPLIDVLFLRAGDAVGGAAIGLVAWARPTDAPTWLLGLGMAAAALMLLVGRRLSGLGDAPDAPTEKARGTFLTAPAESG